MSSVLDHAVRSATIVVFFLSFLHSSTTATPAFSAPLDIAQFTPPSILNPSSHPFKNVAYYVNWATYVRNFHPQNIIADTITHVHYAYANVSPTNGTVYLSDSYADVGKKFPTDAQNETGDNLYGCTKQLYLLKKRNRHLKVILSVGGATFTENFAKALATERGRKTFASSSVALLAELGFDGLEIDWESRANGSQAENYVSTLKDVRCALDEYAVVNRLDYRFVLTAAVAANPKRFNVPYFAAMDKYLDYWNLMAYDYAGSFNNVTGHASNLYPSHFNKLSTPFSTQQALQTYLTAGISSHKVTLGMPLYGRVFLQTTGFGKPYHGVGNGSWGQEGIWDYKALPLAGAKEVYYAELGASYSHSIPNSMTSGYKYGDVTGGGREDIVTYDKQRMAENKAAYIVEKKLGGGMWWESSGDKSGAESLMGTVAKALERCGGLDRSDNWLEYPMSRYDNLRDGMKGE